MRPVTELVPHRPPWALVDRVLSVDGETVTAEKRVSAGDPLVRDGGLAGPLVLEALAQGAAAKRETQDAQLALARLARSSAEAR